VHPTYRVPHRADIAIGAVVTLLVLTVDLRGAIGFSSFGVLLYYLVANLAAFTQPADRRRFPRALQLLGAAGCLVLVATLPWPAILAGGAVFLAGIAYRLLWARQQAG
jgi:APA family basic amino acid/polyamine antiporter